MGDRRFGISTHLFHEEPLTREHLARVAAHGFDALEVFATRSHFDYRDAGAIARLASWLADTRLTLHSMHAPIVEGIRNGQWIGSFSTAAADEARRKATVAETTAVLAVARTLPFRYLVLHLGVPASIPPPSLDNQFDAAVRSIEEIVEAATPVGVQVALEVIPNALSSPDALIRLIEDRLEGLGVGVCLDYGHANLMGDVGEAIEAVSGHLVTTHVHDNRGQLDEHLLPFGGTIDWDAAMMGTQKIGYDDVLMFEVAGNGEPLAVLQRSAAARERLHKAFVTF